MKIIHISNRYINTGSVSVEVCIACCEVTDLKRSDITGTNFIQLDKIYWSFGLDFPYKKGISMHDYQEDIIIGRVGTCVFHIDEQGEKYEVIKTIFKGVK